MTTERAPQPPTSSAPPSASSPAAGDRDSGATSPAVPLESLDELWFQVGGTLCNLSCHHCFISCHPGNDTFGFLSLDTVRRYLDESVELGVREYYFTGGEPFLHREMLDILELTLEYGPATVLTNGTVFTPSRSQRRSTIQRLGAIERASPYSLEIRVSIDGHDSATNDPIRGEGTFESAMAGVIGLAEAGFLPIITMAQTWPEDETPRVTERFLATLRERGYDRPRLKILPTLHLGEETSRTRGYDDVERVTPEMMRDYDKSQLLCSRGRIVTDRGVAVCPILIESESAHMGPRLRDALEPARLSEGACYTCYQYGAICSNALTRGGSE